MENEIISPSEFLALVNQTLAYAIPQVVVQGEVSSYKVSQGKWVFFDLKDDESTVNCFMPIYSLSTVIEDGMLIRVLASPNVTKWGRFSLTVKQVELAGEGSVKQAFEKLKADFTREGLFAAEHKKSLPEYPQKIALVTSAQAAAYSDFVKIISERWPHLIIDQYQVQVQGLSAPDSITTAIREANESPNNYDVLVLIRGGGSLEDLQAFNNELVVRAVYGSRIPTLVAIGHENDESLAELAADLRAATPTDAAAKLVPDKRIVLSNISNLIYQAGASVETSLVERKNLVTRLFTASSALSSTLAAQVEFSTAKMQVAMLAKITQNQVKLTNLSKLLSSYAPSNVLKRGYSIATVGGKILFDATVLKPDDTIMLQLAKGKLKLKQTKE